MLDSLPEFVPIRLLAERWQCSKMHIFNLIDDGTIQTIFKQGRMVRIPKSEVERVECGSLKNTVDITQQSDELMERLKGIPRVPRMRN